MQDSRSLAVRQVRTGGEGLHFACLPAASAVRHWQATRGKVSAEMREFGGQGGSVSWLRLTPRAQNALVANYLMQQRFSFRKKFSTKNKGSESSSLSEPNLSSTPEVPGTEIGARPPSTMFRLPSKNKIKTL
jgi:hypothetical protein